MQPPTYYTAYQVYCRRNVVVNRNQILQLRDFNTADCRAALPYANYAMAYYPFTRQVQVNADRLLMP